MRWLELPKQPNAYATTPNHASFNTAGDVEGIMCAEMSTWAPAGVDFNFAAFASKWLTQQSWLFGMGTLTKVPQFFWSTTGANSLNIVHGTALPFVSGVGWMKWYFDVDNGAGGRTLSVWTSTQPRETAIGSLVWTPLGTPTTTAGVTSVFAGSGILELGGFGVFEEWLGRIYYFQFSRAGGAAVANPDFRIQEPGALSFNDAAGRPWTVTLPAQILTDEIPVPPQPLIKMALNDQTAPPVWQDITQYVLDDGITINRGKKDELGQYGTGQATVPVRNDKGQFDPNNPSSPFYPNLKSNRRIWIGFRWTPPGGVSTEYPRFVGYIDRKPYDNNKGWNAPMVTLRCIDHLGILAQTDNPSSVWEYEVEKSNPHVWYRLSDPTSSPIVWDSSDNKIHATNVGVLFGADGILGATATNPQGTTPENKAARWPGPNNDHSKVIKVPQEGSLSGGAHTLMTTIKFDRLAHASNPFGITHYLFFQDAWPGSVLQMWILGYDTDLKSGGYLAVLMGDGYLGPIGIMAYDSVWNTAVDISVLSNQYRVDDGVPHLICWRYDQTAASLRVDQAERGRPETGYEYNTGYNLPEHEVVLGSTGAGESVAMGFMDEWLWWRRKLTDAEVIALEQAAVTPWIGDTTGARMNRLLDIAEVRADLRSIDVGVNTLAAVDKLSEKVLQQMQETALSERGGLYVLKDGVIRFRDRTSLMNDLHQVPQYTFSYKEVTGELPYADQIIDDGLDAIINDARISAKGAETTVLSQASIDEYHHRTHKEEMDAATGLAAEDLANWLVQKYSEPKQIVRGFRLKPYGHNAVTTAALALDLEWCVKAKWRAQYGGITLETTGTVQSLDEFITRTEWLVEVTLDRAHPQGNYLVLDHATKGKLDLNRVGF